MSSVDLLHQFQQCTSVPDADRVRDVRLARHARGDSACRVRVFFGTHDGHRDVFRTPSTAMSPGAAREILFVVWIMYVAIQPIFPLSVDTAGHGAYCLQTRASLHAERGSCSMKPAYSLVHMGMRRSVP